MNRRTGSLVAAIFAIATVPTKAQWINYPTPRMPRTADGKPNLSAPAPRAADGKPDLSGLWRAEPAGAVEVTRMFGDLTPFIVPGDDPSQFSKYFLNILSDFKPGEEPIRPNRPGALATQPKRNPCLPSLFLTSQLIDAGFKLIQTPDEIVILYAAWNFRQIYMDGRKPPADPQPLWWGYSVGTWEGDKLVVDTTGFNDKTSLGLGHSHSDALRLIERFRRRDFGHMDVEVTIDDPKIYTKPFTIKFTELLLPDSDVMEYVCEENEQDVQHLIR
jgi:hypothetical protein